MGRRRQNLPQVHRIAHLADDLARQTNLKSTGLVPGISYELSLYQISEEKTRQSYDRPDQTTEALHEGLITPLAVVATVGVGVGVGIPGLSPAV